MSEFIGTRQLSLTSFEQNSHGTSSLTLERLTLVIPSFERKKYMLRAMHFWSGIGPQVHVMDGSRSALSEEELVSIKDNVHYHHMPIGFYDRLRSAIQHVQTEFCALIGDDEFYLKSGLEAAISYLDEHSDTVACGGRALRFWNFDNEIFWVEDYKRFINYSVKGPDAGQRMIDHMSNYTPSTIYAVSRADAWKNALNLMVQKEYAAYALGELQFELAMAYQGNSVVLNVPFWLRSSENESVRGTDISLTPENTFVGWWGSSQTALEKETMLENMATHFSLWSGEGRAKVKNTIELALDGYIKTTESLGGNSGFMNRLIRALKWRVERVIFPRSYAPGGVWKRISSLIEYFKPVMPDGSVSDLVEIHKLLSCFHFAKKKM